MGTGTTGVSPANGVSDPMETAAPTSARVNRWPFVLAGAVVIVLAAAAITGAALGSSYQPIRFGNFGGGLSRPIITRQVNNFPPMDGQLYLPPQKSVRGGLLVSLTNNGHFPVTILSASLNPPDAQRPVFRESEPLRDAGAATYWPLAGSPTGTGTRLAGMTIKPGQSIFVRLPVTTAGCWMPAHGYSTISAFWVKVKFMFWTHLVQIWWTSPYDQSEGAIIAHEPETQSRGGVCAR